MRMILVKEQIDLNQMIRQLLVVFLNRIKNVDYESRNWHLARL